MVRVFDKNMFIMMLAIMVGIVIVTYFIADIVYQSQIDEINTDHVSKIKTLEQNNINFTSSFLESSVLLDSAREDRAFGNYHFDLAQLFYTSALNEDNETTMNQYKNSSIDNCTLALPNYLTANENFLISAGFFEKTKNFTDYENYLSLLSMYVNLTKTGAKVTLLRYNATIYLRMIVENITFVNGSGFIGNSTNITMLLSMFNDTMAMYGLLAADYEDIQEGIDEYDIKGFSTIREPN
jgi:hypothetical protein